MTVASRRLFPSSRRELVEMLEDIGGIVEHAHGAGALQLLLAIAARQKSDAERPAA